MDRSCGFGFLVSCFLFLVSWFLSSWLLASVSWLLALGPWLLVPGFLFLVQVPSFQVSGFRLFITPSIRPPATFKIQNSKFNIYHSHITHKSWFLVRGSWRSEERRVGEECR